MAGLSLLDLGFFVTESAASPKHVAGLLIFEKPAGAPAGFVRQLHAEFLAHARVEPPFDQVIRFSRTALPRWQQVDAVELKQHVFYHRLERGENDRKSLYRLVAKLHTPMLDRSRPLWEVHVVDGVENGQFALYQKIHHAYADGVTLTRWTSEGLAAAPGDLALRPVSVSYTHLTLPTILRV